MKKPIVLLLCLLLVLPLTGAAASSVSVATANATVVSTNIVQVTAPYAGTLLPFSLKAGDSVAQGDTLFSLDTTKVYASQEGTVMAVFAQVGDDADGVTARYGALAVLEPASALYIDADTKGAYNNADNRYLHAGETLYLKKNSDKGTGRVTSVNGKDFVVELLTGSYDVDDKVTCYRENGYASDSAVGTGTVCRYADISVSGVGRVVAVHKQAGDKVRTGDLLFELVDAAAPSGSSADIAAPIGGAVSLMNVTAGSRVAMGQLLCEITDLTAPELSAEVDEAYLSRVAVGDAVSFTMDAFPDETRTGMVTAIHLLGTVKQNAAYYDVRISLSPEQGLLPGMSATVTLGE